MGISIKNDGVEASIREAAAVMGKPITEAVGVAVRDWLARNSLEAQGAEVARQEAIDEIVRTLHVWPVYDDRDHGDLLYDDAGLPK